VRMGCLFIHLPAHSLTCSFTYLRFVAQSRRDLHVRSACAFTASRLYLLRRATWTHAGLHKAAPWLASSLSDAPHAPAQ
jgi:hypothetical protein